MPAEGIHQTALREATTSTQLDAGVRRCLVRFEDAGRLGAVLVDLPYFEGYALEVARYLVRATPRPSPWGAALHERAAVPVALALLEHARRTRSMEIAALGLGVVSHAAIDRQLHPLINALARREAPLAHDTAHREVEKFQSICFHEVYFGADRMGTAGIVRLVQVPMRELFAKQFVCRAVDEAFAALAPGSASSRLAVMGRGYEQHTSLIGSPLGKRVASEREKERARPRFLSGAWGSFESVLALAVRQSVPVLNRAFALFEAGDSDRDEAERALGAMLPVGSIDPLGESLDLERSFTPALPPDS
ncbi:MAG: zinc dependent phospholipase C family protein [Polyangiaceae bacterium]